MNRDQLRHNVASRTNLESDHIARAIESMLSAMSKALARGESVSIRGLGMLETRSTRDGRRSVRLRPARVRRATPTDIESTTTLFGGVMDHRPNQDERSGSGAWRSAFAGNRAARPRHRYEPDRAHARNGSRRQDGDPAQRVRLGSLLEVHRKHPETEQGGLSPERWARDLHLR
ncbi:MAG: HU family DNA-binding protein [Blastocatellia bacterium]|nr:HU family DNA-binding protein [Blastocatellia bacterium]